MYMYILAIPLGFALGYIIFGIGLICIYELDAIKDFFEFIFYSICDFFEFIFKSLFSKEYKRKKKEMKNISIIALK